MTALSVWEGSGPQWTRVNPEWYRNRRFSESKSLQDLVPQDQEETRGEGYAPGPTYPPKGGDCHRQRATSLRMWRTLPPLWLPSRSTDRIHSGTGPVSGRTNFYMSR